MKINENMWVWNFVKFESLVQLWSWGFLTPQRVQHMASLLVDDLIAAREGRLDMTLPERLSKIGEHGTNPNHCNRDMKDIVDLYVPELSYSKVPLRKGKNGFEDNAFT